MWVAWLGQPRIMVPPQQPFGKCFLKARTEVIPLPDVSHRRHGDSCRVQQVVNQAVASSRRPRASSAMAAETLREYVVVVVPPET